MLVSAISNCGILDNGAITVIVLSIVLCRAQDFGWTVCCAQDREKNLKYNGAGRLQTNLSKHRLGSRARAGDRSRRGQLQASKPCSRGWMPLSLFLRRCVPLSPLRLTLRVAMALHRNSTSSDTVTLPGILSALYQLRFSELDPTSFARPLLSKP